jgi:hypothetical protein
MGKEGWLAVDRGDENGEVGAVHHQEMTMRRKRNRDRNGWGGGPVEVSKNKLQQTKSSGP